VKFLVDAQLPARLVVLLASAGHDAIHTSSLPNGNRSTDAEITAVADAEERVVVTKDGDFRDAHLLRHAPRRLLLVLTGNIGKASYGDGHVMTDDEFEADWAESEQD
jgi:predicted nuclease of predicted toxin-antitoxin system